MIRPAPRILAMLAAVLVIASSVGPLIAPVSAAAARSWHLVALGDSIPYGGVYCGHCTPYPNLLGEAIAAQSGRRVTVTDLGIPGLTTSQLVADVRTRADIRGAIAGADIVTLTIGHNDTPWNSRHDSCDGARAWFGPYRDAAWSTYTGACLAREADLLGARLRAILREVRALRGSRPTLVELTTDWNQVLGQTGVTPVARAASKAVLDRYATATCAAATAFGARCGDVYHAFNGPTGTHAAGPLLATDHDHASQQGHRKIAALLAAFGFGPLVP